MGRRRSSKGVLPPVRSGHAPIEDLGGYKAPLLFWITLDKRTVDEIHRKGFKEIEIQTPTGELIVKKVRPRNLFMGNKICIYKRSTGEWALRDFATDRRRHAKHVPEIVDIRDSEGHIIGRETKGMTGDRPRKRRRRRRR